MRTLGNILWHIPFLGFLSAALVYLVGVLLVATLVAAPIGLGLMEYGKFLFAPFTRGMVNKSDLNIAQNAAWKAYSFVIMLVYLPFGLILAFLSLCQVILLALSIVGIPLAVIVAKSLGTYLNPVHKKCVHVAIVNDINRLKAYKNMPLATAQTSNVGAPLIAASPVNTIKALPNALNQSTLNQSNSVEIIGGNKVKFGTMLFFFAAMTIGGAFMIMTADADAPLVWLWLGTIVLAWQTIKLIQVYRNGFCIRLDEVGFEFSYGVMERIRYEWHGIDSFKVEKELLMPKKIKIKFSKNYKLSAAVKNTFSNKDTIPNMYALPLEQICEKLNDWKTKSTESLANEKD